jgi:hypothetical protein
MSRIAIVIGLSDNHADSKPELVYLGRSGADMRSAIAASVYPRHIEIPFATGIPKNNPRAAANAAALAAAKPARRK